MELFDLYQPAPGPIDSRGMPRYTEDELRKIADLKEDKLNQAELHYDEAIGARTVTISSVVPPAKGPFAPIIAAGTAVDYVYPDIMYDQTTGVITAPYDGEYVCRAGISIPDPGGTITLEQWLEIGGFINIGAVAAGNEFVVQNEQTKAITCHWQWTMPAVAGDVIDINHAAYADGFTATVGANVYLEVKRLR